MKTGIKETLENIKAIGLFEPNLEDRLTKYHEDPVNGPEMAIYKTYAGQKIRFELNLEADYNNDRQIHLKSYDLMLPRKYPGPKHHTNNGIDSKELENRMRPSTGAVTLAIFSTAMATKNG